MTRAYLVAGLGYGDEGKGATVDFLAREYGAGLIVRYNGGAQAAHNVVQPDGRQHTFAQFGSGMFHPGVRTHLSRFMLVNPINQMREEQALREVGITDAWERTTVDPRALIITPFHRAVNRFNAEPGFHNAKQENTCGQGIGECREFHLNYGEKALFAGDIKKGWGWTTQKLRFIRETILGRWRTMPPLVAGEDDLEVCWKWYKEWPAKIQRLSTQTETAPVIFEGAQGVLLDETYGMAGFNTWTDCTFNNALRILDEDGGTDNYIRVGVIRSYYTRHGAGPFPTEDADLTYPEPHNGDDGYQGKFRRGHFDYVAFARALRIVEGIDMLAINHLDQIQVSLGAGIRSLPSIQAHGPTYKDRVLTGEI